MSKYRVWKFVQCVRSDDNGIVSSCPDNSFSFSPSSPKLPWRRVAQVSDTRTWRDEVSPEIVDEMDDILRAWLPPVLVARFGLT